METAPTADRGLAVDFYLNRAVCPVRCVLHPPGQGGDGHTLVHVVRKAARSFRHRPVNVGFRQIVYPQPDDVLGARRLMGRDPLRSVQLAGSDRRYLNGLSSSAACSFILLVEPLRNSSAFRTVTKPRIWAWPSPHSCAQAISYWNSGFPVFVRISAVVTLGTNQIGIVRPGMASCFTRNSGTPKLWMTSLLRSFTMTGLFTGR